MASTSQLRDARTIRLPGVLGCGWPYRFPGQEAQQVASHHRLGLGRRAFVEHSRVGGLGERDELQGRREVGSPEEARGGEGVEEDLNERLRRCVRNRCAGSLIA